MSDRFPKTNSRRAWPLLPGFLSLLGLLGVLAQGCMVGPSYTRPSVPQQESWHPTEAAAAKPVDGAWWRGLNDPLLVKYIETGLSQNQDLEAAQARIREARALRGVAAAVLLPEVSSSAAYSRSRISENAGLAAQAPAGFLKFEQSLFQVGFDAGWEIDLFGGRRREVEAAGARAEASVEAYRDAMVSVMAEIARNYVELRGAQRQLSVAEKNSDIQDKTLALVESKLDAEVGSELEVAQAKAQLERIRAAIPSFRASIRASAHRLAVLTGQTPDSLLEELLATAPIPDPPDMVPVGLPSDLLLRRPDLRRAENDLHAATADIGAATADLYPRFSLTGSSSLDSERFVNLFRGSSGAWSIGPSISWPVFQGGRIRSNIAATEARRDEALARYRQAVLTALEEVETALVRYAERQVERERLALSLESQAKAVEMSQVRYREGVQDFLPVLDAERQLSEVENSLAVSETQVLVNLISLYKALGGGWDAEALALDTVPVTSKAPEGLQYTR